MRDELLVRRLAHVCMALAPFYYLIPEELPVVGVGRWVLLVLFFVGIVAFEAYRLRKGVSFFGLRPHEKDQIASFAWAAAGITLVLWLFPHDIATAALVGMALVDPLAGELRHAGKTPVMVLFLCILAYFTIAAAILSLAGVRTALGALTMSLAGSFAAVISEWFKVKYVDDDFLMAVVPAIVMLAISQLF